MGAAGKNIEPDKTVMRHSSRVEGEKRNLSLVPGLHDSILDQGEKKMSAAKSMTIKPGYTAENGRILCFAPPLMMGFRGCPLALSSAKFSNKTKSGIRRNYAKRRAFVS